VGWIGGCRPDSLAGATAKPDIQSSAAIGPDGTVYLANHQGVLFALQDGSSAAQERAGLCPEPDIVWSVSLGSGRLTSSPTVGPDGTIYALSGSGWLYAISPEGRVLWTFEIRTVRRAVALGVTFIDMADSHGPHLSEELIHEALYPYPPDPVIATKAARYAPDLTSGIRSAVRNICASNVR